MKYFLLFVLFTVCLKLNTFSQSQDAFSKGKSYVSAGYGIVNTWKWFLKTYTSYPPNTYKVTASGPYTLIYEYAFSKRISAGVALGYSKVKGKFNGFGEHFTETLTGYSFLARGNYHFGHNSKFDPYIGAGMGYINFNYHNDLPGTINSKQPPSFGYSAQLGAHYYFVQGMGVYAELGYVGGSIAQLGITASFK